MRQGANRRAIARMSNICARMHSDRAPSTPQGCRLVRGATISGWLWWWGGWVLVGGRGRVGSLQIRSTVTSPEAGALLRADYLTETAILSNALLPDRNRRAVLKAIRVLNELNIGAWAGSPMGPRRIAGKQRAARSAWIRGPVALWPPWPDVGIESPRDLSAGVF